MSGGILVWLIVGVALFFFFSRNESLMGHCRCHGHHKPWPPKRRYPGPEDDAALYGEIIDLKKEDYSIQ